MKRHPCLEPLSRDHFEGLTLARHLGLEGASVLPAFRAAWETDLRDHFEEEERLLMPLCTSEDAARLVREHREIAELGETAATDEQARLLGQRLHDHIRWEERELFVRVETAPEATLRSLAEETNRIEGRRENPLRAELVARRPKPDDPLPFADLSYFSTVAPVGGPRWGTETEDLNATLLVWRDGEGVAEHVNDDVDVIMVGVEGEGEVTVDGRLYRFAKGQTLVIPKASSRAIRALSPRFGYLNVHKRRRKLAVGLIPKRSES
jgi:mannose-6-phosphate isomerase-like protein (cupin superfamily)